MDCVTTRKISEIFPKNVEILFGGRRTEKKLGKMTKKRSSEIQKFPRENVEIFCVVREPRQNLSSGPLVGKG